MGKIVFEAVTKSIHSLYSWGLYETDGTADGTKLLNHFGPDRANMTLYGVYAVSDGSVSFHADANNQYDFGYHFTKNGTFEGTIPISEIDGANAYSDGSIVYYHRDIRQGNGGQFVFASDGTQAGTRLLLDLPGTQYSSFNFFTYNSDVCVEYNNLSVGRQIVQNLTGGDASPQFDFIGGGAAAFFQFGSNLIFANYTDNSGYELWVSDGTTAGTHALKDINRGYQSGFQYYGPNDLISDEVNNYFVIGSKLMFSADDGKHGFELWETDGTTAGTVLVKDTALGLESGVQAFYRSAKIDDTLFFLSLISVQNPFEDPKTGYDIWQTDGTSGGTHRVQMQIDGHVIHGIPTQLASIGTKLLFEGFQDSKQTISALYSYDTVTHITLLVKDLVKTGANGVEYDNIASYNNLGNNLVFYAGPRFGGDGLAQGYDEIWITDGTAGGTHMVKDIYPGAAGSAPSYMTVVGDARTSGLGDVVVSTRADGDAINGEGGDDQLTGGGGSDLLIGDAGDDILNGAGGRDRLDGGIDRDRINGGGSADSLVGRAGADKLFGADGNDRLTGGNGNDVLTGGSGADIFLFDISNFGNDQISDFEDDIDKIAFKRAVADAFSDLHITGNGTSDITLTVPGLAGQSIYVHGDHAIILTTDDFLFLA